MILLVLVTLTIGLLPRPAEADAARWRWPLARHDVVQGFRFDRAAPFAAGARRGVDLRARAGAAVSAVCTGEVLFAGNVPGPRARGLGVTLGCGQLRATELGLGRLDVGAGARVHAGAPIGRAGRSGRIRLGARLAGTRRGYVDPLSLLGPDGVPAPDLGPAPRSRRPLGREPAHTLRAAPARPRAASRSPSGVAWAGVALAGAALGAGVPLAGAGLRRRRRARDVASHPGAQTSYPRTSGRTH